MPQASSRPRAPRQALLTALCGLLTPVLAAGQDRVEVADSEALREALQRATPGTEIVLARDAVYEGGIEVTGVRGEIGRRIVIRSTDPEHPAILRGGDRSGLYLKNATWLAISDLVIEKARSHGLEIDDGGADSETRAEGILLERITVRDVGSSGNHDAVKLSGVTGFRIHDCRIERWGDWGSGIDLTGCRDGEIAGCTLVQRRNKGHSGIAIQGGSRNVAVRSCRLEHAGLRALNLGGHTGLQFFRPDPENQAPRRFEAKDLVVEGCTVIGSETPLAFVGVDGAVVHMNTFYLPEKWVLRILQESKEGFLPCRGGVMTRNLLVLDKRSLKHGLSAGEGTAADSFRFESNAWWTERGSIKASVRLPSRERRPVHGRQPRFVDEEEFDLRQHRRSPLRKFGADAFGHEQQRRY